MTWGGRLKSLIEDFALQDSGRMSKITRNFERIEGPDENLVLILEVESRPAAHTLLPNIPSPLYFTAQIFHLSAFKYARNRHLETRRA